MKHQIVTATFVAILQVASCQTVRQESARNQSATVVQAVKQEPSSVTVDDAFKSGTKTYTGRYSNHEYGFSVQIPEGLSGVGDSSPSPQHGVRIILSNQPEAIISVYADYNSAMYDSTNEALSDKIKGKEKSVEVLERENLKLASLAASSIMFKYTDNESHASVVSKMITALRPDSSNDEPQVIYTLHLETPESRYPSDAEVFRQVLASFKLQPLGQ
jgi:hypothetical protein